MLPQSEYTFNDVFIDVYGRSIIYLQYSHFYRAEAMQAAGFRNHNPADIEKQLYQKAKSSEEYRVSFIRAIAIMRK